MNQSHIHRLVQIIWNYLPFSKEGHQPKRTDRLVGFDEKGDPVIEQPSDEWARSAFERDRDRLLYSRELRRLKDVTQVARADESYLYHDRLSHSLKVAQVGHRLTELLHKRHRNNDSSFDISDVCNPSVVEAACLAHDMGHPPFGHHSEQCLDRMVREKTDDDYFSWMGSADEPIGYEGNAQSFRIVTRLADHYSTDLGFGLTRATLNAIQKYPHSRQKDDEKWGYYPTEEKPFKFAREMANGDKKGVEADIMDYADDLTYAIHDMIDFYMSGRIPLDRLFLENNNREGYETKASSETKRFKEYLKNKGKSPDALDVERLFSDISDFPHAGDSLFDPFSGTPEQRKELSRFRSNLVGRYLSDADKRNPEFVWLSYDDVDETYHLEKSSRAVDEIETLKQLTFCYVIDDSTLMAQQRGQERLIRELYEALYEEAGKNDLQNSAIPEPYVSWLSEDNDNRDKTHKARTVADMIASLTEPQAVSLHKRLTGDAPGSLQDQLVR